MHIEQTTRRFHIDTLVPVVDLGEPRPVLAFRPSQRNAECLAQGKFLILLRRVDVCSKSNEQVRPHNQRSGLLPFESGFDRQGSFAGSISVLTLHIYQL